MKHLKGYTLSPGYNMLTLFTFDAKTHRRISTRTTRPIQGLDRRHRYLVHADVLRDEGLPVPSFVESGNP